MDAGRTYRVGRDPTNDIVIEHGSVSRHHCELRQQDDGTVLLVDLHSMNGTAVRQNGQWDHIEQATVERDERILLGEIVTTVAALLVRAPKTSDRSAEKAASPAPRKIPKPTTLAKPENSGLIARIIPSDWARLHRRAGEKPRRDEPSICLPSIVSVPVAEEPAHALREEPSLHPAKQAVAPVISGDAPLPSAPLLAVAAGTAPAGVSAANTPILSSAPPAPPAPADGIVVPREAPSLLVPSQSLQHGAASARKGSSPRPFKPYPRRRFLPRWLPRPNSPEFAKWAVVGSLLVLTSGGAVAAYIKYGPTIGGDTRMAAVASAREADPATRPDTDEFDRAPGERPAPAKPAKRSDERKSDAARLPTEPKTDVPPGGSSKPNEPVITGGRSRLWHQAIEGTPDSAVTAAAASREGLCLAGTTSLSGNGIEAWIVRVDGAGQVRWQRRPGSPRRDGVLAVTGSGDGGCVAAGFDSDETRLWIFKLDSAGVQVWTRSIAAGHTGRAVAIVRTHDGGYAVAAHAKAAPGRHARAFVLRLSARGDIHWSKFAGHVEGTAADLRETRDGGFILAGIAHENGVPRALWTARLDRHGRTLWDETYNGGAPQSARIEIARGNEYIIAATMPGLHGEGSALRLLRISDVGGDVIWDRRHGTAARRVAGLVLAKGGILVAGDSGSDSVKPELWLTQFDARGRAVRESRLPAGRGDRAAALTELKDGRLVIVGTAEVEGAAQRGAGMIFLDRSLQLAAKN